MSPVDTFYNNLHVYEAELAEMLDETKPKRGRPRKNRIYFTPITEAAIVAFNEETSASKKHAVYTNYINDVLYKLAENVLNTYKFPYMDGTEEDIKHEVVCFMFEKLGKYKKDKGRAFSYFSKVAKNYLIQANRRAYKKLKQTISFNALQSAQLNTFIDNSNTQIEDGSSWEEAYAVFIDQFLTEYESQVENIFNNNRDVVIAYAVLRLFKNQDLHQGVVPFHKKALYILIREQVDTRTEYITRVINRIKVDWTEAYNAFVEERYA